MKNVFIIREDYDIQTQREYIKTSTDIIAVVDDLSLIPGILEKYYGKYIVIENRDVRDSGIEYILRIKVDAYDAVITVMEYTLNEL